MFLYIQDEQYAGQYRYSHPGVALQTRLPSIAEKPPCLSSVECVTESRTRIAPFAPSWGEWKPMIVGFCSTRGFPGADGRSGVSAVAGRQKACGDAGISCCIYRCCCFYLRSGCPGWLRPDGRARNGRRARQDFLPRIFNTGDISSCNNPRRIESSQGMSRWISRTSNPARGSVLSKGSR